MGTKSIFTYSSADSTAHPQSLQPKSTPLAAVPNAGTGLGREVPTFRGGKKGGEKKKINSQ